MEMIINDVKIMEISISNRQFVNEQLKMHFNEYLKYQVINFTKKHDKNG